MELLEVKQRVMCRHQRLLLRQLRDQARRRERLEVKARVPYRPHHEQEPEASQP